MIACFGNQKGGVGKTTLTNQVANYIHTKTDKSIIVIDGDYLQESLTGARNFEMKAAMAYTKSEYEKQGITFSDEIKLNIEKEFLKNCYKLVTRDNNTIMNSIVDFSEEYDFVLIDLPGTLTAEGVISVYATFDFVFVPTDITWKDLDSTKKFLDMYYNRIKPLRYLNKMKCNIYGVFNKVKENTIEFKQRFEKAKDAGLEIPFLEHYITETNQLKREDSTLELIGLEGIKNKGMIDDFAKEVVEIMNNYK